MGWLYCFLLLPPRSRSSYSTMAKMTILGGGLYRKATQDEDVRHKYNDLILSYDAVTLLHSYVITSFTSSLNMYFSSSYFLKFWYSV